MVARVRNTVVVGGALFALTAAVWPGSPGLTFSIRTTSAAADTAAAGAQSQSDSIPTQFLDGVLRFDTPKEKGKDDQQLIPPGSYWLVSAAERTMTVVMPARRQYWDARFDSTAAVLAQAFASMPVLTDIEVSGSALGSGGTVNGYPTRRYRITTRYTEVPANDSSGSRTTVQAVEDMWVTEAMKDVPDPMEAYTRLFRSTGGESGTVNELMEKRGAAQRKLFKGLPIRTVVTSTETEADGQKKVETYTTDILHLKRVDLDPAGFRVPEGYTRVDLNAMVRSAMKDAVKESAKEGAKESAKEAAKGAIKGIFGRRKKP